MRILFVFFCFCFCCFVLLVCVCSEPHERFRQMQVKTYDFCIAGRRTDGIGFLCEKMQQCVKEGGRVKLNPTHIAFTTSATYDRSIQSNLANS